SSLLRLTQAHSSQGLTKLRALVFLHTMLVCYIIAFAIFILVKQINRLKKPEPAAAQTMKAYPTAARPHPFRRPSVRTVRPTSQMHCGQSNRDNSFQQT